MEQREKPYNIMSLEVTIIWKTLTIKVSLTPIMDISNKSVFFIYLAYFSLNGPNLEFLKISDTMHVALTSGLN